MLMLWVLVNKCVLTIIKDNFMLAIKWNNKIQILAWSLWSTYIEQNEKLCILAKNDNDWRAKKKNF